MNMTSSEFSEIRAELFSMISKADGKVKPEENKAVEELLSDEPMIKSDFAQALYHWSVKTEIEEAERHDIFSKLENLDMAQKVNLVKAFWTIAIADGEIHPLEKVQIQTIMKIMGVEDDQMDLG